MAQFHFFATRSDLLVLLDRVFSETDLRVLEMYSEWEKPIREYRTVSEFEAYYSVGKFPFALSHNADLTLWSPSVLARRPVEKYALAPEACQGKTFAYRAADSSAFYLSSGSCGEDWIEMSRILHNSKGSSDNVRNWKRHGQVLRMLRGLVLETLPRGCVVERISGISQISVMSEAFHLSRTGQVRLVMWPGYETGCTVIEKDA